MRYIVLTWYTFLKSLMKMSYGPYKIFYDFQRGKTQKLRKQDHQFLCGTLCPDLIYIPF